jgi:hypothetical protein
MTTDTGGRYCAGAGGPNTYADSKTYTDSKTYADSKSGLEHRWNRQ